MADGLFYGDLRLPFITASPASVTLASTDKSLYPAGFFPLLGANYFGFPGKHAFLRMFGRITTGATPGNLTWDIYWGNGTDANGTILQSSAAQALTASQTNLSWELALWIYCTTAGSAGALFVTGHAMFNEAVVAPKMLIPASAAATSASVDLTAANIISVQAKRSGSTAETMQVHGIEFIGF